MNVLIRIMCEEYFYVDNYVYISYDDMHSHLTVTSSTSGNTSEFSRRILRLAHCEPLSVRVIQVSETLWFMGHEKCSPFTSVKGTNW